MHFQCALHKSYQFTVVTFGRNFGLSSVWLILTQTEISHALWKMVFERKIEVLHVKNIKQNCKIRLVPLILMGNTNL